MESAWEPFQLWLFNLVTCSSFHTALVGLAFASNVWSPSRTFKGFYNGMSTKLHGPFTLGLVIFVSVAFLSTVVLDWLSQVLFARLVTLFSILFMGIPYLAKASPLRSDPSRGIKLSPKEKRRSFADPLVFTSLFYMFAGIYAFSVGQYGIALLQIYTSMGSTLYHLTRETMFFNCDNIGATSLLLLTAYGLYLSLGIDLGWTILAAAGIPLGGAILHKCGMPGEVCKGKRTCCSEYPSWHSAWHVASSFGTVISVYFFEKNFPDHEAGAGWFAEMPFLPIAPTIAVVISVVQNFIGNKAGVMPLK
uniref:Uncharacterized protein n=1 Tax=Fibrocapsa japonica TaxID=94617 RepID=A0A7S2XVH3_9STRA|mmetsp:Transcript_12779/g.18862  ORF Transcript_12779/g.18862 Transcript_12779/m.18862 type:complete len:306 (+) Transcript_12779:156-1073(+)